MLTVFIKKRIIQERGDSESRNTNLILKHIENRYDDYENKQDFLGGLSYNFNVFKGFNSSVYISYICNKNIIGLKNNMRI